MRIAAAAVVLALVSAGAHAAELEAHSKIDAVTVYPDGATVTRVIEAELAPGETTIVARDFPQTLDPASLRIEGEGATQVSIGAVDARVPRPERPATHPELEKRLEALKDERAAIADAISAATIRRQFAERFATDVPLGLGEKSDARPLAEWRAAFAAVGEEIAAADALIRANGMKARDLDRAIAALEADLKASPARKMEVRIEVAAEAAGRAALRVSYNVRGARWRPLYDARLDTGTRERKPTLALVRRAEIVQETGEDWSNVALAVSTVRTAKGGSAPELSPLIVRYQEPATVTRRQPRAKMDLAAPPAPAAHFESFAMREKEAAIETGGFQVLFRIPGRVSVVASEGRKALRIATATVAPDLAVYAVPALDDAAYLQATFKQTDEAPLLPGAISLYRDGVFVGRGTMPLVPKDEEVRLGFGVDEKVKIARAVVRRVEGSTGIITSTKTDEREYKITVRSSHAQPIRARVEEQVPVSEIADVQVEVLTMTTPPTDRDARDRRGVFGWEFEAKPGETHEIKLGWRVRWPADKAIIYSPHAP